MNNQYPISVRLAAAIDECRLSPWQGIQALNIVSTVMDLEHECAQLRSKLDDLIKRLEEMGVRL